MRFLPLPIALLSAALSVAGCGAVAAGPPRTERAKERKVRRLMREAQEAFADPDLDEAQADEEALESERGP